MVGKGGQGGRIVSGQKKCGQKCRVELVLLPFQKRREATGFGDEQDPSESE